MRRLSTTMHKQFKIYYFNEFRRIKMTDEKREHQKMSKMEKK